MGNKILTKKGNRNFAGLKPNTMSKSRYGIIINYYDYKAKNKYCDIPFNFSDILNIGDLFHQFYDICHYYGIPNGFGYISKRLVLINPIGELYANRYYISDKGRKRLEFLRKLKAKRQIKL